MEYWSSSPSTSSMRRVIRVRIESTLPQRDHHTNTALYLIDIDLLRLTAYSREMYKCLADDFDFILQEIVNLIVYFNNVTNRSLVLTNLDNRSFRATFHVLNRADEILVFDHSDNIIKFEFSHGLVLQDSRDGGYEVKLLFFVIPPNGGYANMPSFSSVVDFSGNLYE